MINIAFYGNVGFEINGHSGFAQEGEDIICASVSSAAYLVVNMLSESANKEIQAIVDDAYMKVEIIKPDEVTNIILNGLKMHFDQLSRQYPEYVVINQQNQSKLTEV